VAGHTRALHELTPLAVEARVSGRTEAREDFERTVAVLREENSTWRRAFEAATARADALLTELTRSVAGIQPVAAPPPVPAPPRRTTKDPIDGLGNVLDPVPLGDPMGMFTTERAASLMLADEDEERAA
jgi:hypothetical protein